MPASVLPEMDQSPTVFTGVRRLSPASLVAALLLSVAISVAANFVLFKSELLRAPMRQSQGLINGTLIANLGLILVVVVLCLGCWGGARANDLGLRRRDIGPAVWLTLLTWLYLNVLTVAAALFAGQGVHPSRTFESAAAIRASLGELLGQLFGNALYEEVLFRGVLLVQIALWLAPDRTEPGRRKVFLALLVSQAIFAMQHIPNRLAFDRWHDAGDVALEMIGFFSSGLFLAGVFMRTRNLLLAVGMHTLVNLPMALVAGPSWAHPVGIGVALIVLMAIGPRLSRA